MVLFARTALALATALLLSACLVTPGKFTSTLDVRADRSFAFTYKGEVIALNMDKAMEGPEPPAGSGGETSDSGLIQRIAMQDEGRKEQQDDAPSPPGSFAESKPDSTAKLEAMAAALSKEKGFRSARYMGNNRFEIDYAISGKLTHSFLFPFNSDAQIVFPFVAVELRGNDRVRVKAPGYANSADKTQNPMGGGAESEEAAQALDGTFTLTTNAAIVSQNQEDGPTAVAGGQRILWKVDPLTSEAPMAVLKVAP